METGREMPRITAITEVYGSGQEITGAALEYAAEIKGKQLCTEDFAAAGRRIACLHVTDRIQGVPRPQGRFVILTFERGPEGEVRELVGRGPHARMAVREIRVKITQKKMLYSCDGGCFPAFSERENEAVYGGAADRFHQCCFVPKGAEGRRLTYQLFCPEKLAEGERVPLVCFLHDAGSCSDDPRAPLIQGNGAVVWAREGEQRERPCFIVAPQYPQVCANDAFEVTWEAEATVELIEELERTYPIDRTRIYGTGQSMGCMMLCELSRRHPDLFAGCLLVAGQWNPQTMKEAAGQHYWAVVSQGDEKAFPIMGDCFDAMEQSGALVTRGHVDAKAETVLLEEYLERQRQAGDHLFFTWFEGKTVLPSGTPDFSGMHHISTWAKAYDLATLRRWLFAQRRELEKDNSREDRRDIR